MPSLSLDENQARYQIRGFKPGIIQVNDQQLTSSIIVSPMQLIEHWPPTTVQELTYAHLKQVITLQPNILIIGTGVKLQFPALDTYGELINQGIGVEVMDTAAACRTYNALTAENRRVVAALLLR